VINSCAAPHRLETLHEINDILFDPVKVVGLYNDIISSFGDDTANDDG